MLVNLNNIKAAYNIYDRLSNWKTSRDVITMFLNENPRNDVLSTVLIKVVLIDSLYMTNLKGSVAMAKHIVDIPSLKNDIETGNIEAVEKIRKFTKDVLSFASKYCHFHRKDKYPMYDRYVCLALNSLNRLQNWKESHRDYRYFFDETNKLRLSSGCKDFEEIDTFLWLYGQRERLMTGKEDINKEVKELYSKERYLFDLLA